MIMSKRGRFPGSSFIQILRRRRMWDDIPGGIVMRNPSSATCSRYVGLISFHINTNMMYDMLAK